MRLPEKITLRLDQIKPYTNNPRTIPEEAVEAVRSSIDEYGYVQPILVDAHNVIVAGHTRYLALTALGVKEVEVYRNKALTEEQARKYRLVDNRTHELSDWAHDKLMAELREWEEDLLRSHFSSIDLNVAQTTAGTVTEEQIEAGELKTNTVTQAKQTHMTEVRCPGCYGVFKVKTASLPGLTPEDFIALSG